MLVNFPIKIEDFSKGIDALLDFYKKLGWDSEKQTLFPTKVLINYNDSNDCFNHFVSSGKTPEEKTQYGLLWMNKGPSASLDIPRGKVKLEEGWVEALQ